MLNNVLKVILAAGTSNRFGVRNKMLARIKKKSVIEQILFRVLKVSKSSRNIIVISGYESMKLKYFINRFKTKIFFNKNFRCGLGSSVSLVFKKKLHDKTGIMFIPGDMPLISEKDYSKLLNVFLKNKKKIICPSYFGKIGNWFDQNL